MQSSELFLASWAIIATVIAIFYHHCTKTLKIALLVHQLGIRMVGEGKAKIVINGDNVKVMEI